EEDRAIVPKPAKRRTAINIAEHANFLLCIVFPLSLLHPLKGGVLYIPLNNLFSFLFYALHFTSCDFYSFK
ncbi:MAG: hypothetical protein QXZ14_02690, partial [Candidatus Jordarchaeales archaeon]